MLDSLAISADIDDLAPASLPGLTSTCCYALALLLLQSGHL
uniref:Uncharacterized protein n=1 Tax=Arundo donax TaxID=35708 RepID=A0A0A9GBQ9_ARUDO